MLFSHQSLKILLVTAGKQLLTKTRRLYCFWAGNWKLQAHMVDCDRYFLTVGKHDIDESIVLLMGTCAWFTGLSHKLWWLVHVRS
jgi:hypothetical protein